MAKFIVSRKTWLRGEGTAASGLLRGSEMCCLGFVASQCGVSDRALRGSGSPRILKATTRRKLPAWLLQRDDNSDAAYEAMKINDSKEITDQEREKRLSAIFRANGDQLVFRP